MHQPFYKDLVTQEYMLPWVRLHAIKDYYDMAAYLDNYPKIKAVFNVVPSLLVQIEDYAAGTAKDKFLDLTIKDPGDLTSDEKIFILKNFFLANWDTMIKPYPRYNDLLLKRGRFVTIDDIASVSKRFTNHEYFDLQVWFNLTWFGSIYRQNDPVIKAMLEKGRDFGLEDKENVVKKQIEIMRLIIPKYKEMQEKGQIEVSLTPYYHPILPLLCDTNISRISNPNNMLPKNRFNFPQDASAQVERAVAYYREKFGTDPCGMWPSEGSVSEDIIPIISASGIKWIASDEEILQNTLEHRLSAGELFKPYTIEKDGVHVDMIFRDHMISDDLGFVYSKWDARDAASDVIAKLHKIADVLPDDGKKYLVSIILDGENAWEYYKNNGKDFFDNLYAGLSRDHKLETVRVKDFIEQNRPFTKLNKLFPGSWINHNFDIWIGHSEDNAAWDHLFKAREILSCADNAPPLAWEELYIAEGSDWNWWYGNDHSSGNDEEFDALFRKHIINIYRLLGRDYPKTLETPIKKMTTVKSVREPVYFIKPILDGEVSNYYEWLSAGLYSVEYARGAMHQTEILIRNIYYGFSREEFFVRIDHSVYLDCHDPESKDISFEIDILKPVQYKISLCCNEKCEKELWVSKLQSSGHFEKTKSLTTYGVGRIIEIGVPFCDLEIKDGDEVNFTVAVRKSGKEIESWPKGGMIVFKAPDEEFAASSWFV